MAKLKKTRPDIIDNIYVMGDKTSNLSKAARIEYNGQYIELSYDKFFFKENDKFRRITDLKTFLKCYAERNIFDAKKQYEIDCSNIKIYYGYRTGEISLDKPSSDSTDSNVKVLNEIYAMKPVAKKSGKDDNYIAVTAKIDGYGSEEDESEKVLFKKKSEIFYYDVDGKQKLSSLDTSKTHVMPELYLADNTKISLLDDKQEYVTDGPYIREQFNNVTKSVDFVVTRGFTDKKGKTHELGEELKSDQLDQTFSVFSPSATVSEQDPRHPGKMHDVKKLKVETYNHSQKGEYVRVTVKESGQDQAYKLENLSYNGSELTAKNIVSFIGKELTIKEGGNKVGETEPLTKEQALILFEKANFYKPTTNKDDILTNNSYLQLEDGHLVKETVEPKAYNIATGDGKYDAYLLVVDNGKGVQGGTIISKEFINSISGDTFNYGGKIYSKQQLKKLERTSDNSTAQVIQTSSKNKDFEEASLMIKVTDSGVDLLSDAETIRSNAKEKFVDLYKKGEYTLDGVFLQNEFKKIDKKNPRVVESDYEIIDDPIQDTLAYKWIKNKKVDFIYDKKGNLKRVKGGPTKSHPAELFSIYGYIASGLLLGGLSLLSPLGLLVCAAAPVLIPGVVGLAGAIAVGATLYEGACILGNAVKSLAKYVARINEKSLGIEKKSDIIHQSAHKKIKSLVKDIESQVKKRDSKELNNPTTKNIIDSKFSDMEKVLARMGKGNRNIVLETSKKGIKISGDNSYEVRQFIDKLNNDNTKLKKMKKQLNKAKNSFEKLDAKKNLKSQAGKSLSKRFEDKYELKKTEYENLNADKAELSKSVEERLSGKQKVETTFEADSGYNKARNLINNGRNYLKFIVDAKMAIEAQNNVSTTKVNGKEYGTKDLQKFIKHTHLNFNTGEVVYQHGLKKSLAKSLKLGTEHEKLNSKMSPVDDIISDLHTASEQERKVYVNYSKKIGAQPSSVCDTNKNELTSKNTTDDVKLPETSEHHKGLDGVESPETSKSHKEPDKDKESGKGKGEKSTEKLNPEGIDDLFI